MVKIDDFLFTDDFLSIKNLTCVKYEMSQVSKYVFITKKGLFSLFYALVYKFGPRPRFQNKKLTQQSQLLKVTGRYFFENLPFDKH